MATDVEGSFSPPCDFSDERPHKLGLNAWVEHSGTDGGIAENLDSEVS